MLKVIFFGSSDYCLPVLNSLVSNFQLAAVVTKPDQPVGRKKILTPSAVKKFALKQNITVYSPKNQDELTSLVKHFQHLKPDIAIVSDYGLIIPIEIFQIPKFQTLNIHFSKLPKLRGPSPVQYTILSGDKSAWISVIIMDKEIDSGDVVWQREFKLNGDENSEVLYNKLFNIAALELPGVIKKYIKREFQVKQQDHPQASYTRKLTKVDGFVPWEILSTSINGKIPAKKQLTKWPVSKIIQSKFLTLNSGLLIYNALRAFTPWPGLWTIVKINNQNRRLKILQAHLETKTQQPKTKDQPASPTRLVSLHDKARSVERAGGRLKTILVLDEVQLEGKNPVTWKQFLQGYPQLSV